MTRFSLGRFLLVLFIFCFMITGSAAVFAQTTSLNPSAHAALAEGAQFEQRHQLSSALDSDRRALKLAGGVCAECYEAVIKLQLRMELPKDAVSSASAWSAHASTPVERSQAELLEARSLMAFYGQKPKDSLLRQADDVLKQASIDNPSDPAIHLLRGRVLATLKMDAEAKDEFSACAASSGATPVECLRAKNFAHDPSLARGEQAPEFTITRPDGTVVTLDSLAGKVVLIDFWATWCPPCNRDRDYIQSIAEEFQKGNFVLLGISSDKNETVWKNYLKDNDMLGIQVRDSFDGINDLFHVEGIPTYIVLDGNGMVRLRVTGPEGDIRGKVRALLASDTSTSKQQTATSAGSKSQ
ncbi:hypothetical protein GCM10011507_18950 [Edaphobacter acidisoli]|uniref:Thioredoxin domain-containing protein n=2 Tax=Edaphobacter acidisoli TaxID=2040573 RepID=A0A916RSJ7_9BACT|nr:hypothetical protein GCM10011507_18950 [Edaphobacter acidisoli]